MNPKRIISFLIAASLSLSLFSCNSNSSESSSNNNTAFQSDSNDNISESSGSDELSSNSDSSSTPSIQSGDYYFIKEDGPINADTNTVWLTLKKISPTDFRGVECTYEFTIGYMDKKTGDRNKLYNQGYVYFKDNERLGFIQMPSDETNWNALDIRVDGNGNMTFFGDYNNSELVKNINDLGTVDKSTLPNSQGDDDIVGEFLGYMQSYGATALTKTNGSRGFYITFTDVTENGLTLTWDCFGRPSNTYAIPTNYTINGTNYGSIYCTYKLVDLGSGRRYAIVLDNAVYFDTDEGYESYLFFTDRWNGKPELNIASDPKVATEGDHRLGPLSSDFRKQDYEFLSKKNSGNMADNKDNWYLWVDYDSRASAEYYYKDPRTNSIHIDVSNSGPDPWSVQAKYEWLKLEKGAVYHVEFDYQIVLPEKYRSAVKESTFSFQHNGGSYDTYYEEPIHMTTTDGDYNHVDSTFAMSTTDSNVFMGFSVGGLGSGVTAKVDIENLRIERIR